MPVRMFPPPFVVASGISRASTICRQSLTQRPPLGGRYRNTKLKSKVTVPDAGTTALGAAGGLPLAS